MNSIVDFSSTVAIFFAVALAVLAGAVLVVRHMVRKKDVLHGDYIEHNED
jgi:hypothetical protein